MLTGKGCPANMLSIKDALEALEGRWKILILFSLSSGPKRFTQISKEVGGTTDKTLSKELKSLEVNKLVKRYRVVAAARNPDALKDLIQQYGDSIFALQLDVNDRTGCFEAVKKAQDHLVSSPEKI
jgi:hypothetical protein